MSYRPIYYTAFFFTEMDMNGYYVLVSIWSDESSYTYIEWKMLDFLLTRFVCRLLATFQNHFKNIKTIYIYFAYFNNSFKTIGS